VKRRIGPQDLEEALAATHARDPETGILMAKDAQPFEYSDGARAEEYLAAAVRDAKDVGVGSPELSACIRDWPSLYHLSPARQNLLRPIAHGFGDAVLEIGPGCGAITRQLGESGATVLAVEGSPRRAAIAASRCRDLPNVVVACGNFADLSIDLRFDCVTLIGVLEYSRMFLDGDDPVQEMLRRALTFLEKDGVLAIAIENQLGLKYLTGAREDHTGLAYFGVTDQYGPKTAVTFGEKELRERLASAGCAAVEALYPFPDYKLPSSIVTEGGFAHPGLNVTDLIATTSARRHPHEGPFAYSESLARGVFVRNGLGAATANSFLFLAGPGEASRKRFPNPSLLAFSYATTRDRPFAKETRWVDTGGGIRVERRALHDAKPGAGLPVRMRLADEDYVSGEVLHRTIERTVGRRGWSIDDLVALTRPLAELLKAREAGGKLPPEYFDCTPFNVIRRSSDGALVPFDLEWELADEGGVTLDRVMFRGLWNSLARIEDAAAPAFETPTDILSLATGALERLGLAITGSQVLQWVRDDYAISNAIAGARQERISAIPAFRVGAVGDGRSPVLPRVASGLGGGSTFASNDFRIQLYVATTARGYGEDQSVSVRGGAGGGRIVAHLAFHREDESLAGLRLDPLDVPGLVRIERVAVLNAASELVWETRTCRAPDFKNVSQMRDLSRNVAASSGTLWFAEGADPHFELALPPELMEELRHGGAVQLEMSPLEASELSAIVRLAELAAEIPAEVHESAFEARP
jgi:precorrin-6B methylase 2